MESEKDHELALERTVSSLTTSVLDMACSELDIPFRNSETCSSEDDDTANEQERMAFFKTIREKEYYRLVEGMKNEEVKQKELNVSDEIVKDIQLSGNEKTDTLKGENLLVEENTEEVKSTEQDDTASEEEREQFWRQKQHADFVEAFRREHLKKEAYLKMERESLLAKQIDYFFSRNEYSSMTSIRKSGKRQSSQFQHPSTSKNVTYGHLYRESPSTSYSDMASTIFAPEMVTVLRENKTLSLKVEEKAKPDSPDRPASEIVLKRPNSIKILINRITKKSKSLSDDLKINAESKTTQNECTVAHTELKPAHIDPDTLSDIDDPPRPRLKPFFEQKPVQIHVQETPENIDEEVKTHRPSGIRRIGKWLRNHCCCCWVNVD